MSDKYTIKAEKKLRPMFHPGLPRHRAKAIKNTNGRSLADETISSFATYSKYKSQLSEMLRYYGEKKITVNRENVEELAGAYLREKAENGVRTTTLRSIRSAIAKAYSIPDVNSIIELPEVKAEDIIRERGEVPERVLRAREKHADLSTFVTATGLRIKGNKAITGANLFDYEGKTYIVVREKGGKIRACPILATDVDKSVIDKMIADANNEKIIKSIPKNMWMHDLRARFASRFYCLLERDLLSLPTSQLYFSKSGNIYDRFALSTVAVALGHGPQRLYEVVKSYTHRIPEESRELDKLCSDDYERLRKLAHEYEEGLRKLNKNGKAVEYFKSKPWR